MMQQEPLVTATVSRRRSARDRVRQRPGLFERLMPLPLQMLKILYLMRKVNLLKLDQTHKIY